MHLYCIHNIQYSENALAQIRLHGKDLGISRGCFGGQEAEEGRILP
jgi:hypothetical protein